ncbi:MAG: hypothetical protein ACLUYV_00535 [Alistipes shahii]
MPRPSPRTAGTGNEGAIFNLGVRYFGLGVRLDLDASYGGNQLFYLAGPAASGQGQSESTSSRPAPDKYYSVGLSATLPLYFQRGYHTRQLSVTCGLELLQRHGCRSGQDRMGERQHLQHSAGRFPRGAAQGFVRSRILRPGAHGAPRHRAPLGLHASAPNYTFNPENAHFSDLISFYGQAYLPGFAAHNSVLVAATYQTSIGGYKFPSGYAPLSYKSTRLVPRGYHLRRTSFRTTTRLFRPTTSCRCGIPKGGIGSVIYIKRIRLNAGGDYAQFRDVGRGGMTWRRIWSVGGDIVFDYQRFPAAGVGALRPSLSVLPSVERRVYVAASVGLPLQGERSTG